MAQSIEGGVVIVNTLSTKNNGSYPLCMAESVQLSDGRDVETAIKNFNATAGTSNSNYYFSPSALADGAEAPIGASINDYVMDNTGGIYQIVLGEDGTSLECKKTNSSITMDTISDDDIANLFE